MDTVKVRMQMAAGGAAAAASSSSIVGTFRNIVSNEGAARLYGGLNAGLQRQFAFASIRIGFYEPVKQLYMDRLGLTAAGAGPATLMAVRLLAGITTGAMAVCAAQPTDVVKVRMQGSAGRYPSCAAAYSTIWRTEGLAGLWKGTGPSVARNAIVNCAEVVSYDTIKTYLVARLGMPNARPVQWLHRHLVASPVDVVKTRLMSARPEERAGVVSVARGLYQQSGLRGFYKGFIPSFARIAGWNILMFVLYEKAKSSYGQLAAALPRPVMAKERQVL
uniref:Uncoupling protein 2 n=1 Tax=Macrostomum lignano TaxID=282301 RepID=A0A1I8JIB0_9PLAT